MVAKKKKIMVVVAVRLPESLIETIDEDVIPKVAADNWEGATLTRADAIRHLIRVGIESMRLQESK